MIDQLQKASVEGRRGFLSNCASDFNSDGEKYSGRTKEDYMDIFRDNREDFEYVAKMMQQWPVRSCIDFDSYISSENQEIADEISNNEEFYGHLKNLYDLKEIRYIIVREEEIEFHFYKFPSQYHGGVFYGKNIREEDNIRRKIDDYWMLYMIPNT